MRQLIFRPWVGRHRDLPVAVKRALDQILVQSTGALKQFDGEFQSSWPGPPPLTELIEYALRRFDLVAELLLPMALTPDRGPIHPQFEVKLKALKASTERFVADTLGSRTKPILHIK